MKNVAEVEKKERKVFTEKRSNSTIKKKHNSLKTSEIRGRRDGLYMRETKNTKNEALEGLNLIEKIFFKKRFIEVYQKGVRRGFKWSNNTVR